MNGSRPAPPLWARPAPPQGSEPGTGPSQGTTETRDRPNGTGVVELFDHETLRSKVVVQQNEDDVFIDDGLHLNDKGNRIWAAAIKTVLMKVEAQYEATAE